MIENKNSIKMVVTDLDGTLLDRGHKLSNANLDQLKFLREKKVITVAATGRSLYKVKQVISEDVPFDYVIFSSGAGVYDWKNKKLLKFEEFEKGVAPVLCEKLIEKQQNFIVFEPIPNNNKFWYHQGAGACSEFEQYVKRHTSDCLLLKEDNLPEHAGQMMCIIKHDVHLFQSIKTALYEVRNDIRVIRATSPVNGNFIWLEVFPHTVSKGHATDWLCKELSVSKMEILAIGNDYNDIDLLDFAGVSYMVKNAPNDIKQNYLTVPFTNDEDGFAEIVTQYFKE